MSNERRFRAFTASFVCMVLLASCDQIQGPSTSDPDLLPPCDPIQPRPPCDPKPTSPALVRSIQVVAGDTQVANTGSTLAKPLTVLVTDRNNVPLVNVAVTWSAGTAVSLSSATTPTDANGIARVQLTLGKNAGQFTTVATVQGSSSASVQFTSVAQVNGAYQIKEAPNNSFSQIDSVFARLPHPHQVTVVDYKGAPVAGVAVLWDLNGNGSLSANTSLTDENGIARVTQTLGGRVGTELVVATIPGLVNSPYGFLTVATPGRTTSLNYVTGDEQMGLVNTDAHSPYVVRTMDAYGNQTSDRIEWSVASGGGTLRMINPLTAIHRFGPSAGEQVVTATLPGLGTGVTFRSNAVNIIVNLGVGDYYSCRLGFFPAAFNIPVGGIVAWTWYGDYCFTIHDVTFEDDSAAGSGARASATITRKFSTPGTYRFRCTKHSTSFTDGEIGVVTVQ